MERLSERALCGFLVHLASILLLAVVCCRTPRADEYSYTRPDVIESRASATVEDQTAERNIRKGPQKSRFIAPLPSQKDHDEQHAIKSSESLFEAQTSDISAKWADLQSRIQSEQETLAECRAGSTNCPAAARRFLQIVELGRQRQGRARLARSIAQ